MTPDRWTAPKPTKTIEDRLDAIEDRLDRIADTTHITLALVATITEAR